jgi:hypothetical protein
MGDYHPECPQSQVIYDMLEEPDMAGKFQSLRFADKKELLLVHAGCYVDTLAATSGISTRPGP